VKKKPKNTKTFYDACVERNRMDLLDRWDYSLNEDPKKVWHKTAKPVYLKCPCGKHESVGFIPEHIFKDSVINSTMQPCPKCNSFAQWGIETFGDDFLNKYWDYEKNEYDPWVLQKQSNKKIWVKCNKESHHPNYLTSCPAFFRGNRCPYCKGFQVVPEDSLAAKNPEVLDVWSEQSDILPRLNFVLKRGLLGAMSPD
jgi:hypothetical protein